MTGNILRQRCRLLTRCSYVTVHRSIFSSYVTVHPQHRSIFCSHGGCQHCAASPPTAGHLQLSGVPVARGAAGSEAVLFLLSRMNFSLGNLNSSSTVFIYHLHFTFTWKDYALYQAGHQFYNWQPHDVLQLSRGTNEYEKYFLVCLL